MMLSSESMIINYTTNEIVQNSNPAGPKSSSTPTKAKAQKIQKKIRKESTCSTSTKGTPKQQQQPQQLQKNKQVVSQLTSPSWSEKTVNLTSSTCSTALPSLTSKNSISSSGAASSVSLNGQCIANTQQIHQQTQQQKQNLYQGGSKKKNQTKISPRSQTSSLTSEISSFDLCSYNDGVGSSTSSTNQGGVIQQMSSNNHHANLKIQTEPINFSPIISPIQEPPHYQNIHMNPLDQISPNCSPKSTPFYQQNIGHQHHTQKNHLNNTMSFNTSNNYNQGYSASSPSTQNQYYSNNSGYYVNSASNSNPNPASSKLMNWNVLPIEIQRAAIEKNGKIEDVQMNFDRLVPQIEMPFNKKIAIQKIREAQQLQEQLVHQLANVREGMSLQDAVDDLIDQLKKENGEPIDAARSNKVSSNIAGPASPSCQSKNGVPAKQKKISKKASKQEKNGQQNFVSSTSPQKNTNSGNFSSMVSQNISQVGQINGGRQNDSRTQFNTTFNNNSLNNNNSYNYLPEEQEIQNKETENTNVSTFQQGNQPSRVNMEYGYNSNNHLHPAQGNNHNGIDVYPNLSSNKNGLMSPRKHALSMQGYEEEVMSQQELMNNQMNQYEDFPYQPKLRKYMSDPFGDYYYHNNLNYMNSQGNQGNNNFINHSENMDGALSVIYEDENPYFNQQPQANLTSTNFKKDDDDTLYGYVSQNDTIEDLINSQSKCKQNKNGYFGNISNNFNSSGHFGQYMDEGNNSRAHSGSIRNAGMDSYYNSSNNGHMYNQSMGSTEIFGGNTKQRTSSVATTDLHQSSQRKLEFDYNFEGNNSSFNKIY